MSHTLFNDVPVEQQETVVGGFNDFSQPQIRSLKNKLTVKILGDIFTVVDKLYPIN